MSEPSTPHPQAGSSVDDLCRVCKEVRAHTVIAVDPAGEILRVICRYCSSQHNYRGGAPLSPSTSARTTGSEANTVRRAEAAFPLVSERERTYGLPGRATTAGGGFAEPEI